MVRFINQNNIEKICNIVYGILHIQESLTYIREVNNPKIEPCIYAMWHGNQFAVYGISNRKNINILISNSIDGEIVSKTAQKMGFQIVRGSSNRKGAVSSTLSLIDKLSKGQCVALMVDGPRGPLHDVKPGAIRLAKETGTPIIPVHWYSPNPTFIKFNSWDKMSTPAGPCWIINTYGEPIYVNQDDDENIISERIRNSLLELEKNAPEEYKKARKQAKLWNWK